MYLAGRALKAYLILVVFVGACIASHYSVASDAAVSEDTKTPVIGNLKAAGKWAGNFGAHAVGDTALFYTDDSLAKILPPNAQHLTIVPGTPLFVLAEFPKYSHQYGSVARGGVFFMPGAALGSQQHAQTAKQSRPKELDLGYVITRPMAVRFNTNGIDTGLKEGGQIRSRLEAEGKYQVPIDELGRITKRLYELASNPVEAAKVLGPDWTIVPELRYMQKDANGQLLSDQYGNPIPDPMIDTYYDNDHHDAAKGDKALRYRWANNVGNWNVKPGIGVITPEGLVFRTEYGVDTTDDKPETIHKFADSDSPLNFFKWLGKKPSEFMKPSMKLTDIRHKFKLKHSSGLAIEVSADRVHAEDLRGSGKSSDYGQVEMDVDHLATASLNVAASNYQYGNFNTLSSTISYAQQQFLNGLNEKAYFDGQPSMHMHEDLEAGSPVRKAHEGDFKLAEEVIVSLRNDVIGKNWIQGAQKYAYAAVTAGLVNRREASASVRTTLLQEAKNELAKRRAAAASAATNGAAGNGQATGVAACGSVFN